MTRDTARAANVANVAHLIVVDFFCTSLLRENALNEVPELPKFQTLVTRLVPTCARLSSSQPLVSAPFHLESDDGRNRKRANIPRCHIVYRNPTPPPIWSLQPGNLQR